MAHFRMSALLVLVSWVFFRKSVSLCQNTLGWREGKGWRAIGFPYFGYTTEMFPCGMEQLLECMAVLNTT